MKHSIKSSVVLTMAAALALSFATLAAAQGDALASLYLSAANVPTNIAGIHTYAEPPKGFNPVAATDIELATYGFPPRPDKQADPDHYALWERAMMAAKIRWNGQLTPAPVNQRMMPASGPSQEAAALATTGPQHQSNVNASGVILQNGLKTWSNTASFNVIQTEISVPYTSIPFASPNCFASGYTDLIQLSVAGIDGHVFFSPATGFPLFLPELMGGFYSRINCSSGQTFYVASFGWEFPIGAFAVNPGDQVYTVVHAFGGCNAGSVFLEDLTTLTNASFSVPNPCLTPQIGHYANWVVERLCCDGPGTDGVWPLANTIGISFEGAAAANGSGKFFFPGSQATTTAVLTMTNDQMNQNIEIVHQGSTGFQGQQSLFFETTGCAYTGGCTP